MMHGATMFCAIGALLVIHVTAHLGYFARRDHQCTLDQDEEWSYRGLNGPYHWAELFEEHCGADAKTQSPINIVIANCQSATPTTKLRLLNYNKEVTSARIENKGYTVQVIPLDRILQGISIADGVAPDEKYNLTEIHFHWGDSPHHGSEHLINGRQYSMEMHLVHKHTSIGANPETKTAVIGVLFQEISVNNRHLESIVKALRGIKYKYMRGQVSPFNLNSLLSENPASYCSYDGSLTTPKCDGNVKWFVQQETVHVGKHQMRAFRSLKSVQRPEQNSWYCDLVNNFRPVQPLGARIVSQTT